MDIVAAVSHGFWEQNRLALSALITGVILLIAVALYGIVRAGPAMERMAQAPLTARLLKVGRIVSVLLGVAMVVATLVPRQELGMAVILLIFLWPVIGAQIAVGFISWEKYWQKSGSEAVMLFGLYAFLSIGLLLFVLQLAGYRA
jgi:predicted anti-sigma-YlaC factor YlaD